MPDKIQNNPFNWRDRIGELDQVNGLAPLKKGDAWEKLNNKLEEPGKKKNRAWIWLAAAIATAIVLVIPIYYKGKIGHDQPIVQQPKTPKTISIPESGPVLKAGPAQETQPGYVLVGINGTKQKVNQSKKNNQAISQIEIKTQDEEIHPAISSVRTIPQTDITIEKSMDSPIISVLPVTSRKKKLPVVYLNEIEDLNNHLLTDKQIPKKFRKLNQKYDLSDGNDVFATSRKERFSISLSSAN